MRGNTIDSSLSQSYQTSVLELAVGEGGGGGNI